MTFLKIKKHNDFRCTKNKAHGLASVVLGIALIGTVSVSITQMKPITHIINAQAASTNPQPEGNVIARGEDGVPWELYENGYLLFKPTPEKDTLINNRGKTSWKVNHGANIKHVGFAGKVYAPKDSAHLFSSSDAGFVKYHFDPMTFETANLDTSKVTNMSRMFSGMSKVTNLDVTNFDTSNVTNMHGMFTGMSSLTDLDVTHFNTSKVTDMSWMFQGLAKVTNLDVTNFDTNKVTDMSAMFSGMSSLTNLDLTNFNTSKVTNMSWMFQGLAKVTNLDVTNFDTSNVTNMCCMFSAIPNLTTLDVTKFDTNKVTDMSAMFSGMSSLTNLDLTNFNTSKVTNMSYMFSGMSSLTKLDVTNFDTNKVTDMSYMFQSISKVTNLDVTNFDTNKVTDMSYMFHGMRNLTHLDVTNFNTSNVTDMSAMFLNLSKVASLDVRKFDTSSVTDMSWMFARMSRLTNLDVTHFNTSKATNIGYMFYSMSKLTNLNVKNFDTRNVTDMSYMFNGASSLTRLDVTNFNTSNVTDMSGMFEEMPKLKELKLGDKFNADGIRTIPITHAYGDQYTDKWHKITDKKHPYTVSEWADKYEANPKEMRGTWVREKIPGLAKLYFNDAHLPSVTVKPDDPSLPDLPKPLRLEDGYDFVGWSRDGVKPITRDDVKPGERIQLYPLWSKMEEIPVETVYERDDDLEVGQRHETPGSPGEKHSTVFYKSDGFKKYIRAEKTEIIRKMVPTRITIGTKPTVEMITRENSDPVRRTTNYTVDRDTGDVTESHKDELPATGTLGTLISTISATSLLALTGCLSKLKKD